MNDPDIDLIQRLQSLDGSVHSSRESEILWPSSSPPQPTPEEAVAQARADAIKTGMPFAEPVGDLDAADDEAVERYVDDLLRKLIDG